MSSTEPPQDGTIKDITRPKVGDGYRVILWVQLSGSVRQLPIRVERELDYSTEQVVKVVVPEAGRDNNGNIIKLALAPS